MYTLSSHDVPNPNPRPPQCQRVFSENIASLPRSIVTTLTRTIAAFANGGTWANNDNGQCQEGKHISLLYHIISEIGQGPRQNCAEVWSTNWSLCSQVWSGLVCFKSDGNGVNNDNAQWRVSALLFDILQMGKYVPYLLVKENCVSFNCKLLPRKTRFGLEDPITQKTAWVNSN